MNELSIIFARMGIDTNAVLSAAATKWNFLKFSPGLVGGHCIGVDPYYLTYKAEQLGYHSRIILAGRQINDDMGRYIAENLGSSGVEDGLLSGLSSRTLLPVSAKCALCDRVLAEDDALKERLTLTRDDLRLTRKFNMFTVEHMDE